MGARKFDEENERAEILVLRQLATIGQFGIASFGGEEIEKKFARERVIPANRSKHFAINKVDMFL